MSAFATPLYQNVHSPVFARDSRYRFHHDFEDEAKILALPTGKSAARASIVQALQWLGQYCADHKNRGHLTKREINQAWADKGVNRSSTRTAWRRKLVDSGALIETDTGFQLRTYARFNRTPEEWAEVARKRRESKTAWQANKRAEQRSQDLEFERLSFKRVQDDCPESPHTACSFNFLDSVDTHHIEQSASEPPPPSLSPDLSGPKVLTQRPRSPLRAEPDLRTAPSTSAEHGSKTSMSSFGAVLAKVLPGNLGALEGGSLVNAVASRPIKPARPAQPRPLSKTLGSDKSEKDENLEGGSYAAWALAVVERRREADAELAKAKSKAAEQASP